MLINADGDFQGMLSGGCLEGDLAARASRVIENGQVQTATYDMRGEDDVLWGLGVGCEGMMRILLQPLDLALGFQPFADVLAAMEGDTPAVLATVVASDASTPAPGSAWLQVDDEIRTYGSSDKTRGAVEPALSTAIEEQRTVLQRVASANGEFTVLVSVLQPPPRVLVLGAGLDAEPVVRLCAELGWRVTVQDHRQAYVEKGNFDLAERVLCVPAEDISTALDLGRFDAVIVMSHHLLTDRAYLAQLAPVPLRYLGLLGPPKRRQRLLADLKEKAPANVHGPAGIDIGGRGPQSIALSIVAQMHQALMRGRD